MINELGNVTVLWEELWLSTLQDLHTGCFPYYPTVYQSRNTFLFNYIGELLTTFSCLMDELHCFFYILQLGIYY